MSHDETQSRLAEQFKRYPLLTREKEAKLARKWLKRGNIKARYAILNSNMMNVWIMARRYRFCGQPFEDLVSEGAVALMKALDHYNPDLGIRFWSYASRAVARDMLEYVRRFQSIAARPRKGLLVGGADVVAVNAYDGFGIELADKTSPEDAYAESDIDRRIKKLVHGAMSALSDRQRTIVTHRMIAVRPMTLGDLGKLLGVSKQAVFQSEEKATDVLRKELGRHRDELAEVM